jgi:TolA-binding protein
MMRLSCLISLLLGAGMAWAQDPDDAPPPSAEQPKAETPPAPTAQGVPPVSLAADPDGPKALEAYNAGRYNDAARRFLTLVQRWPREPTPYLALARSRVYAGDAPGAVEAYEIHLKLSPQSAEREKIEAELTAARRKADGANGAPTAKTLKLLETAIVRAKSGLFHGTEGAYGAIDMALEDELIGPQLADTRDAVRAALLEATTDAIDRWWRPAALLTPKALTDLTTAWNSVAAREPLNALETRQRQALAALSALRAGNHVKAAEILAPIAPGDAALRYAQALALLKGDRIAEAEAILSALVEEDPAPRLQVLLGLVRTRLDRPDGVDSIRSAVLDE